MQCPFQALNFIDEMASPLLQNTASRYEVKAIPTFILLHNREVLHTVKGADVAAVEAAIAQHVTTEESSSVGKGGVSVKGAVSVPGQVRVGREHGGSREKSVGGHYEQVDIVCALWINTYTHVQYTHTCTHIPTHTHTHTHTHTLRHQ